MPNYIQDVEGISETCAWLDELTKTQAQSALARALTAAAVPIVREIRAITPETLEGERDENTPHLADSIQSVVSVDPAGKGGRVEIGFGSQGYKALWVEYGHRIVGHRPGLRDTGKISRPNPFMRTGLDMSEDEAIQAFVDSFAKSLREFGVRGRIT